MPIPCARCNAPLPEWELSAGAATCIQCGSPNTVRAFPALLRPAPAADAAEAAIEGEAACFDHPTKRAVAACQQCGRFVCQLCAVDFGAEVLCPSCVSTGRGKAKAANPETSRTLYDSIALLTPLVSLLFFPLTLITAPGAVVFSFMRWDRPLSLVRRNRWRFVAAILVGGIETALWIWLAVYLAAQVRERLNT